MMKRFFFFDNAKFVLITSVILGHLLENSGLNDRVSMGIFDTVFMYAMPAFVFISGIFTPPRQYNDYKTYKKFLLSELGLFETLVLFTLIMKLPILLISGMPIQSFLSPGYTLWYLLALIWWRLLILLIPYNVISHKKTLLALSIMLSFASGFLTWCNSLALQRTLYFLPFFLAGVCMSEKKEQFVTKIEKIPAFYSVLILVLVVISCIYFSYNLAPFSSGNTPYANRNMSLISAILWTPLYVMLCVIVSISVLSLIPNRETIISEFGSKSLVMYVYHAVILLILKFVCQHIGLTINFYIVIIEYVAVVFILLLITKLEIANTLTAPLTRMLKNRNNN